MQNNHRAPQPSPYMIPAAGSTAPPQHGSQMSQHQQQFMIPAQAPAPIMVPAQSAANTTMVLAQQSQPMMVPAQQSQPMMVPAQQSQPMMVPAQQGPPVMIPAQQAPPLMTPAKQAPPNMIPAQQARPQPNPAVHHNPGKLPSAAPIAMRQPQVSQPARTGFTKAQLDTLKSQILVFRKIKKGDLQIPADLLSGIKPLPVGSVPLAAAFPAGGMRPHHQQQQHLPNGGKRMPPPIQSKPPLPSPKPLPAAAPADFLKPRPSSRASEPPKGPRSIHRSAGPLYTLKAPPPQQTAQAAALAAAQQHLAAGGAMNTAAAAAAAAAASATAAANAIQAQAIQMSLATDIPNLLKQEYQRILVRKRKQRQEALEAVLADPEFETKTVKGLVPSVDGKPARGGVVMELRKLRLLEFQTRLRAAVEREQEEVAKMPDRLYKKFQRDAKQLRIELLRSEHKAKDDRQGWLLGNARAWRQAIGDKSAGLKDLRIMRNKGVLRLHERLSRDLVKKNEDDRSRRMEALKANDLEAYQELLKQQQGGAGASSEEEQRFAVISKFLGDTETYLEKLANKVAMVKVSYEIEQHVKEAMEEAKRAGGSDDEIRQAGERAAQEFRNDSDTLRRNKTSKGDAQTRYYELAHSIQEDIIRSPAYLRPPAGASLREYQMVGLRWMVSLYNNHLNGILADEMGLGKTVQVMALIAYLMEHKNNYGPHLIIVPNAVMVNWKSELQQWLPTARCIYYVGSKDERVRKFSQEVLPGKFNILVTTYEFIMRDRSKLCRVDWKYMVIDEAQRLKERQSKLSRDLDVFKVQRRLLLTGTPLQNELRELWNLLNLLLPEVFDDKKTFTDWFDTMLDSAGDDEDAQLLATEKKLVVVHRLHQILVPFMLRRQVQDVEGKLPPKVPVVIKVPMSPYQSAIYNWVKATGTIRLYPSDPRRAKLKQDFASLNNKVMEMRKVCNHPLLSYVEDNGAFNEMVVRQCGKMLILDRLLIKFFLTGHRVLLFSTMTKLLDLLQDYVKWRTLPDGRKMNFRRIDGATPLEMREEAIRDFNRADSDVFIFLLSIRAAGRGLNLQTSDTVIIFDPDPNPKNEEQAIARSHRIGQKKEVRVIHLESLADPVDETKGTDYAAYVMSELEASGKRTRKDSVESLVRNFIQKQKIDMANEVIDAGRFDMQTNMDERRATLEALLQDETRLALAANDAPTWPELNAQLARGPKELEFFNRLDSEMTWYDPLDDIPYWIQYTAQDVRLALDVCQKGTSKTGILAQEAARANGTKPVKAFNPFTSGISRGGSAAGGGARGRGRGRGRPPAAGRGRGGRGAGRSSFAADLASAVLFPEEDDGGDFPMDLGFLPTAPVPLSSARGVVMDAPAEDDEGDEDVGENPAGDDDMEEEVIDANIRDEDVVTEAGPSTSLPADSTAVSSGVAGLGLVVGSDELGDLGDLGDLGSLDVDDLDVADLLSGDGEIDAPSTSYGFTEGGGPAASFGVTGGLTMNGDVDEDGNLQEVDGGVYGVDGDEDDDDGYLGEEGVDPDDDDGIAYSEGVTLGDGRGDGGFDAGDVVSMGWTEGEQGGDGAAWEADAQYDGGDGLDDVDVDAGGGRDGLAGMLAEGGAIDGSLGDVGAEGSFELNGGGAVDAVPDPGAKRLKFKFKFGGQK